MKRPILIVPLVALLAGCAGLRVDQDYDPSVNFHELKTYSWRSSVCKGGDSLVDARIHQAVETALAEKGFQKADGSRTDFLVDCTYLFEETGNPDGMETAISWGIGSRGSFGGINAGQESAVLRKEETLAVEILNPGEGKLLWRGFIRREINAINTPDKSAAETLQMARAILSAFPPKEKTR